MSAILTTTLNNNKLKSVRYLLVENINDDFFMDSPSLFLTSNIFKFFIFLGLILLASACSVPTREYSYPDVNTLEQQRLCQLVSFRKTKQYLVADRKIMPMKKDEIMAPVQDTESDLQKGVYFCGIFQARHYDCSPYQTSRLDGKKCRYQ